MPHSEVPQGLQLGEVQGGQHPQKGGPDHWDLDGSEEAEQVHGVPAGQCAATEKELLQVHTLPQEALSL